MNSRLQSQSVGLSCLLVSLVFFPKTGRIGVRNGILSYPSNKITIKQSSKWQVEKRKVEFHLMNTLTTVVYVCYLK